MKNFPMNIFVDADLSQLLQDNYHLIASRNAEGKTPRDVAVDDWTQHIMSFDIMGIVWKMMK